ncbi:WXG100 family type VII secretion target [Nocardia cerradoensis]|uniref:WXG100 family type VII secretion target n=1 Tax=Nocardia cerradoensis TaxID=85688 RepID=UPI0005852C29|nr:WXG100 family type VII secretion target [Nocardia cerradoensis]NKY44312.1 WXG100 family type VII secretion target [Nocardia cerradoensis]
MSDNGGNVPAPGQPFSVVPEQVRDVGIYIRGLAETLSGALDSAAKDVAELLNGGWTGDYADEFSEGWTEVHDGGRQIFAALATMAEKLGVTAETFQSVDADSAAALGIPTLNWS